MMNIPDQSSSVISFWMRYFLGLTVGMAIGLSPYIGILNVPVFRPLLELIPLTLQNTLIPLSSALMGVVATVIQWHAEEHYSKKYFNRLFLRSVLICFFALFALIIVHTLCVVTIPIKSGRESVSFLVGFSRPTVEPCTLDVSDEACIERLSFDPAEISSFWQDRQLRITRLFLFSAYLFFTGSFAIIVGLIAVRQNQRQKKCKT